jgi:hypothetical protein
MLITNFALKFHFGRSRVEENRDTGFVIYVETAAFGRPQSSVWFLPPVILVPKRAAGLRLADSRGQLSPHGSLFPNRQHWTMRLRNDMMRCRPGQMG